MDGNPMRIFFEPWGTEHTLAGDDLLDIVVRDADAILEIGHWADGVSFCFASENFIATTRNGEQFRH